MKKLKSNFKNSFKKWLPAILVLVFSILVFVSIRPYNIYISSYCYRKANDDIKEFWLLQKTYRARDELETLVRQKQKICKENALTYIFNRNKNLFGEEIRALEEDAEKIRLIIEQGKQRLVKNKDYSKYLNTKIDIKSPSDWKIYNKKFAENRFKFLYPPQSEIFDGDPYSSPIEVKISDNGIDYVYIDKAPYSYSQDQYRGENPIEWIQDTQSSSEVNFDYSKIEYQELNFKNAKKYYRILKWADGEVPRLDYFFGIQNGIPVELSDRSTLTEEEILLVLQSLSIE